MPVVSQFDFVYPITATITFDGALPCVMMFEDVQQWSNHIEGTICCAQKALRRKIVPRNERQVHTEMFTEMLIEFVYAKGGQLYGSVVSKMHMPVPARTMMQ